MPEETCTVTLVLNADALTCDLNQPDGHAGPHRGTTADGQRYWWAYAR
jgi:hypothetical protein